MKRRMVHSATKCSSFMTVGDVDESEAYEATCLSTTDTRTDSNQPACTNSVSYHSSRFFLLSVLTVLMSRSEAFASQSRSSFFGRRLVQMYRGGSSSHQQGRGPGRVASDNHHHGDDRIITTTTSLSDLKCVMQQLPPTSNGYSKNGFNNHNGEYEDGYVNGISSTSATSTDRHLPQRNGRKKPSFSSPSSYRFPVSAATSTAPGGRSRITPVEFVAETKLPTDIGQFQLRAYRIPGAPLGQEPCVIYYREKPPFGGGSDLSVPVRIHDQCLTSEVFGSRRCDCKEQLNMALKYIKQHGGIVIYLQQEGRGIGLANKIAAYSLQDHGLDTVDANLHLGFPDDAREYSVVPSILKDMQITRISLMTNNPRKTNMLTDLGIVVDGTLPMVIPETNQYNRKYMETKASRMDHRNMSRLFIDKTKINGADGPGSVGGSSQGSAAERLAIANGMMAPRRLLQTWGRGGDNENALNKNSKSKNVEVNGVLEDVPEMPANTVHVSLEVVEDVNGGALADEDEQLEGIKARDDGYCLGKESVVLAIEAIKRGEIIVVVDDLDRENEGDFIMAADLCTDLDMAKIIRYSSGVVCIGMEGKRMDALKLPPMVTNNEDPKGTAFSVSVDASKEHGITTGISAGDRAKTMRLLADPDSKPIDFHRPGHIFPLRAKEGGVLVRDGHTEASVDFARLAGLNPAGVLCEIVSEENPTEMMRLPEIKRFCTKHGFVLTSIADLAQYRRETEQQHDLQ